MSFVDVLSRRVGGVVKGCEYAIRMRSFGVSGWGPYSREFAGIYCHQDSVLTELETVRNTVSSADVSQRVEKLCVMLTRTAGNPGMQAEALRNMHAALQGCETRRGASKHCSDVAMALPTLLSVVKKQSFHQEIVGAGMLLLRYCCQYLLRHGE